MKRFSTFFPTLLLMVILLTGCDNPGNTSSEQVVQENIENDTNHDEVKDNDTSAKLAKPGEFSYHNYHNSRFGFCVNYPMSLLVPQGESQNMDGQEFASASGNILMSAYARHSLDETISNEFRNDSSVVASTGKSITYAAQKGSWYVLSGKEGSKIFYQKTYLKDGNFISLLFEYPENKKAEFEPVMMQILKDFPACKHEQEQQKVS